MLVLECPVFHLRPVRLAYILTPVSGSWEDKIRQGENIPSHLQGEFEWIFVHRFLELILVRSATRSTD